MFSHDFDHISTEAPPLVAMKMFFSYPTTLVLSQFYLFVVGYLNICRIYLGVRCASGEWIIAIIVALHAKISRRKAGITMGAYPNWSSPIPNSPKFWCGKKSPWSFLVKFFPLNLAENLKIIWTPILNVDWSRQTTVKFLKMNCVDFQGKCQEELPEQFMACRICLGGFTIQEMVIQLWKIGT